MLLWVKCYQIALHTTEKSSIKGQVDDMANFIFVLRNRQGFPDSSVVKNPPANARNMGLILDPVSPTFLAATKPVHHNY